MGNDSVSVVKANLTLAEVASVADEVLKSLAGRQMTYAEIRAVLQCIEKTLDKTIEETVFPDKSFFDYFSVSPTSAFSGLRNKTEPPC